MTRFWRSDHGAFRWIMILLQSHTPAHPPPPPPPPPHPTPPTPHYHTLPFLQHEESECLIIPDNHFCFSCQYSVRFMCLCGSALHVFPERHTDWPSAARLPCPPCDGLSCSAASGSERGIITPCPSAGSFLGLVRITWKPAKRFAELLRSILGHVTNSEAAEARPCQR